MAAGVRQLVIFGAGGHGRVVLDICRAAGLEVLGFLDSDPRLHGLQVEDLPILGGLEYLRANAGRIGGVVPAIGDNRARRAVAEAARRIVPLAGVRHPMTWVSPTARVGAGCVVCPLAAVNTGAVVGDLAILNTACTVEHDCSVGAAAFVGPGARLLGGAMLEPGAFVGSNAVILPGRWVGRDAIVGAGAVVTRHVSAGAVVVGVPARPLVESVPAASRPDETSCIDVSAKGE